MIVLFITGYCNECDEELLNLEDLELQSDESYSSVIEGLKTAVKNHEEFCEGEYDD